MQCDGVVGTMAMILGAAVLLSIAALTADIHASNSAEVGTGLGQGYGNVATLPGDKAVAGTAIRCT